MYISILKKHIMDIEYLKHKLEVLNIEKKYLEEVISKNQTSLTEIQKEIKFLSDKMVFAKKNTASNRLAIRRKNNCIETDLRLDILEYFQKITNISYFIFRKASRLLKGFNLV